MTRRAALLLAALLAVFLPAGAAGYAPRFQQGKPQLVTTETVHGHAYLCGTWLFTSRWAPPRVPTLAITECLLKQNAAAPVKPAGPVA